MFSTFRAHHKNLEASLKFQYASFMPEERKACFKQKPRHHF
ncbi:hypothetical protein CEV32_2909 [Brucella rhizosphaerae]|uniref:Uncharacterized protein n=1 Tax=Brucella rhizosphaerae TaxID=571254 RepID=A0A256F0J0_9HYPH|nr:hypothetical protein CEV32_2909 [Brucella rhizosphaerae]